MTDNVCETDVGPGFPEYRSAALRTATITLPSLATAIARLARVLFPNNCL
jgi:hypothetical protein